MTEEFYIWLAFTLLFGVAVLWKPFVARMFLGFFFMVMALGVNLSLALSDPRQFVALGSESYILFYRYIFDQWVAAEPLVFIIPVILFELIAGVMILGREGGARSALLGVTIFLVLIAPLNQATLPNLILAAETWLLIRDDLGRSLLDAVRRQPRASAISRH